MPPIAIIAMRVQQPVTKAVQLISAEQLQSLCFVGRHDAVAPLPYQKVRTIHVAIPVKVGPRLGSITTIVLATKASSPPVLAPPRSP